MLKGGVIMDVINVEQARIAEEAGAVPPRRSSKDWRLATCVARCPPLEGGFGVPTRSPLMLNAKLLRLAITRPDVRPPPRSPADV